MLLAIKDQLFARGVNRDEEVPLILSLQYKHITSTV